MSTEPVGFVVFDIDGTLADLSHRLHHIVNPENTKDWDAFYGACVDDQPITEMVAICRAVAREFSIQFWTGRSDRVRRETVEWLRLHVGPWVLESAIRMRADGDYRPDHVVKAEYLDPDNPPVAIFEDRDGPVEAFRDKGIRVLQVAPGDF